MAAATRLENVHIIADTNTIAGPARIYLVLSGGSDAAVLTMTVGSSDLNLKAAIGETVALPAPIKLGSGVTATFSLTGTAAKAYAIEEINR